MSIEPNQKPSSIRYQAELTFKYLLEFFKNPIHKIASLPDWEWLHLVAVLIMTSIVSGILAGLVSRSIYHAIFGIFILPVLSLITEFILASFFYYYFQVFEKRMVSFKRLWALVIFANIPFFLFQVVSSLLAPITLIGLAFTGLLLVVGLSENFQMDKRRAMRLIGILYFVIFLVWLWNKVELSSLDRKMSASTFTSGSKTTGAS